MHPGSHASLRIQLASVQSLEDLDFLVRAAGCRPRRESVPLDHLAATGQVQRALSLGASQGCRWIAAGTALPPDRVAARLARRAERHPEISCFMVFAPSYRRLALSVSLPPYPVLGVPLDEPDPVALHCLERLRGPATEAGLAMAVRVLRALDGQAAGQRFFEAFRGVLIRMRDSLPQRIPSADRHALALLNLTRILFLYFVQARGWLDGRSRFLSEEVDRVLAARRGLHANLFRPLFFGTLNQPRGQRGATAVRLGAIPFLNGGLFEPHPLERRWRPTFPDDILRDGFDQLFERFHFTVGDTDGAAIAPDMLGRVFEGVMDPDERGATGTFYTPAALVDDVLTAAFEAHLASRFRCGAGEAGRRLRDPDAETREVMAALRILDPAVGSGAFLLGALHRLADIQGGRGIGAAHAVLSQNLFGVDLNPAAVRLAELRLWLAIVARDTAEDPAEVAPLPNLDSLIRVGDSLGEMRFQGAAGCAPATVDRVRRCRTALLVAVGTAKRQAQRELEGAEREVAAELLDRRMARVQARLRDLTAVRRSTTLFGEPRGLDRRERAAMEQLRAERAHLHGARRRLVRDGVLPWFEYHAQFADVFAERGGFDLVVGNPPWVRAEQLAPVTRAMLAARFRWWVATGPGGYRHQPDLAVAFLERAFELAAPGGTVAMLVPAKVATAGYAAPARTGLARDHTLHCLANLSSDPRATFDATVYPMLVVASRHTPPREQQVRLTLRDGGSQAVREQSALGGAPWILDPAAPVSAMDAVVAGHPQLRDRFRASLGVKTGCNDLFVDPQAPIEPELLRWALRGRDVRAFTVQLRHRLLWTHGANGLPLERLPRQAAAWLGPHGARLRARTDWAGGAEWSLFRTAAACREHRVVWADLAGRLEAVALSGPAAEVIVPLNSCYVLPAGSTREAARLSAWLNCTWVRAVAASTADRAAGGFRRFKASVVESLPLPAAVLRDDGLAELGMAGAEGRLRQEDLDDACNRHLSLGTRDRDALARLVPAAGDRRR